MRPAAGSPFDRLRASPWLPVLLLLLALASAAAGFHAAAHVSIVEQAAATTPATTDESGDSTGAYHHQCPACRLLGAWSIALAPLVGVSAHPAPALSWARPSHEGAVHRTDLVARWQQRLKQGPPQFSR